ncbi:hypothetical protein MNEG_9535 [Monoraphidium neglectum]|uniref:Uncharacterized protein n=1 Tax=Monoraphidium neglectum TaxID=145388 RepID=A0A0D2KS79_9CHLO|nr:hypothetical protein MNEG_9535 [Monoraphidium neglectum]KIY98428.1 hypothetical protein MNEG_9535 [Monoraphidium neglectum]|eukprot:XP_013897448.1 hypothetical protein MNEG_9535 [Monoraphidium neglectum]
MGEQNDLERGGVKSFIYKEGRPKRNSNFLAFLFVVGVAGVVAFAVLAVTTQNSKNSCPCANPYKQLGYDRLYDITECHKDNSFMECFNRKTNQWIRYTGLAGGCGALIVLSLAALRYS